jgi:hypothetical protein
VDQASQTRPPRHIIPTHEQAALSHRRKLAGLDPQAPAIGLALSGGGVRSATFCLGLLRALARNKVLHRFDYLSTVSGGGYTGSAFGRLFNARVKPAEVEAGLADDGSLFLWWLRSNGRYLVPAGMRDLLQTWAGQFRGFVATQFEVTMLLALMSCLIVLPHLLGYRWAVASAPLLTSTLWWVMLPLAGWMAIFMAFAYWWSRDPEDGSIWGDVTICVCTSAMAVYLLSPIWSATAPVQGKVSMAVIGGVMLAVPLSRLWLLVRPAHPARDRVRYTVGLSNALKVLLLLFVLGASDLLSWFLADQFGPVSRHGSVLTSAGLAAMLVAVARFALPLLQTRNGKTGATKLPLALLANLCGLVLVVLLALFWLSALQYFVFVARLSAVNTWMHWLVVLEPGTTHMPAADTWLRWLTVAVPCLAYVVLTGSNLQLINRSSLHAFYRSRIARTYVSVGNSPGGQQANGPVRFPVSPLKSKSPGNANNVEKLTELLDGDDIALPDYAPHHHGGPIHLINCCINQTIDDRTDTYNADRKGVYLTVSSLGLETGTKFAQRAPHEPDPLAHSTLAEWIAVSGAAAGSGMGSMTRTGISALFFLSGLRLGYWWRNRLNMRAFWWERLGKSRAALQEMLARFPGLQSPVWYLSDGGHFDNTGVYSLLKRELGVIVLADCGADPSYVFADLENLIRKARIDFDTTIDFIDPDSLPIGIGASLCDRFGTPDSIMPGPGNQHLLLARISYPSGATGSLLIVKPRLYCEVPLDVAGYADRQRDFPQQSTAEQFFDESQWESYCQLGDVLGETIDMPLLDMLPALAAKGRVTRANAVSADEQKSSMTRRQRVGATIGASLSLGALATVALTGWQAWSTHLTDTSANEQAVSVQQRDADTVQTDLEAGTAYDRPMHARIYALIQKFDDARRSAGMAKAMNQLASTLNHSCGRLDPASPLVDRCLADYSALRAAVTEPTMWQKAMLDYRDAMPHAALPILDSPGDVDYASLAPAPADAMPISNGAPAPVTPAGEADMPSPPPPPPPPPTDVPIAASVAETPGSAIGRAAPTLPATAAAPADHATVPSPTTATDAAAAATRACSGAAAELPQQLVVYTQIYDESQRAPAARLLQQFAAFGVATPGIENVAATANRAGHSPPAAWTKPVLLFSSYSAEAPACARSLARWLATQPDFQGVRPSALPLPIRLHGDADTIEFWLPVPGGRPRH